jgi:hypothetical protein
VVEVLLQALTPKQRKASNMRAAYCAACSSGCLPVLQLLLGVAAAAPAQQLPVLLQAAAEAGNLYVWRMLLQQGAVEATPQQQQQQEGQQQVEEAAAAVLPCLDWFCLTLQDLTLALHVTLPRRESNAASVSRTSQEQQLQASEDARRLQMADLLWQLLVVQQDREDTLREFLRAPVPSKRRGTQHPLLAIDAAAEAAMLGTGLYTAEPGRILNSRVLFCQYGSNPGAKGIKRWKLNAARVLWLQQHQLLPKEQQLSACSALSIATEMTSGTGDFACALQLHKAATALGKLQKPDDNITVVTDVVEGSICGHLRRACAAGDAAAVAQLERLAGFASNICYDIKASQQQLAGGEGLSMVTGHHQQN